MSRARDTRRGFAMVECIVAMAILSVSALVIHNAVGQAITTRGQAQDFTTARFLLEEMVADVDMQPQVVEGSGSGTFPAPHERFAYSWEITRVNVPLPPLPPDLTEEEREHIRDQYRSAMGRLRVRITWARAGIEFQAVGETLMGRGKLWQPPEI